MDAKNNSLALLEMMPYPAFLVQNNTIIHTNNAAAQMIQVGQIIDDLIVSGKQEYVEMSEGVLCLTIDIGDVSYGASVLRNGEYDVFLLDLEIQDAHLQAIALAAQEMRKPLASLMTVSDRYFAERVGNTSPEEEKYIAQTNRSLYQMLRLVNNMADAGRYQKANAQHLQSWNITSITNDLLDHVAILMKATGRTFVCHRLEGLIFGMIDKEKFERALYNLISNAAKFSPEFSPVTVSLTQNGKKLYCTIENQCDGTPLNPQTIFNRFMRRPGIEDGRMGVGLGMVFARSAATLHNGTVLVSQPAPDTIRVTFSIELRESKPGMLHSSIPIADYAGERDHGLIELSDFLPASEYIGIN